MQEIWVQSLDWKEGMATQSSILAWKVPTDRESWQVTVHGVAKTEWLSPAQLSRCQRNNTIQYPFKKNKALGKLTGKNPDAGKYQGQEEKHVTEDEVVGWHHQLSGQEFEQTLGDGEIQGILACCCPWGLRAGHDWATEQQQQKTRSRSRLTHSEHQIYLSVSLHPTKGHVL